MWTQEIQDKYEARERQIEERAKDLRLRDSRELVECVLDLEARLQKLEDFIELAKCEGVFPDHVR